MEKQIIPECFADTLLIEMLVPSKKGYNHQHNCFKVESTMKKINGFALGIIDKDKKQIRYLEIFDVVDSLEDDLLLWRHKDLNLHHWIIQICPALEKWMMKVCEMENINISVFGPNPLDGIKRVTKSTERLDSPMLRGLLSEIGKKDNNAAVRKLKNWIRVLKEKNYQVDKNELINV